jgi:hypothetical protein
MYRNFCAPRSRITSTHRALTIRWEAGGDITVVIDAGVSNILKRRSIWEGYRRCLLAGGVWKCALSDGTQRLFQNDEICLYHPAPGIGLLEDVSTLLASSTDNAARV